MTSLVPGSKADFGLANDRLHPESTLSLSNIVKKGGPLLQSSLKDY
jgi:hypothetical protein